MVTPRVPVELADDLRLVADAVRSGRVQDLTGEQRQRAADAAELVADALAALAAAMVAGDKQEAAG